MNNDNWKQGTRDLFEDTCHVVMHNRGDSKREMTVEISNFNEGKYLVLALKWPGIETVLEPSLQYYPKTGEYAGSLMGIEFTSFGPEQLVND